MRKMVFKTVHMVRDIIIFPICIYSSVFDSCFFKNLKAFKSFIRVFAILYLKLD